MRKYTVLYLDGEVVSLLYLDEEVSCVSLQKEDNLEDRVGSN